MSGPNNELCRSLLFQDPEVLPSRILMHCRKKLQFIARLKIIALPAPFNLPLLATGTDLTKRRSATGPAAFMASESNHRSKDLIACVISLEGLPESIISDSISEFIVVRRTKLLSQVPSEIRNLLLEPMAIPAVEAAVRN